MQNLNEREFNELINSKGSILVMFSAPWCAACKTMLPQVEELSITFKEINFAKIDVSEYPGLASRMGVMSLPNILFIKKGKVADQIIGATSLKNIEDKLKNIK